jgi:flagellar hook-associated protein 3 FlgL
MSISALGAQSGPVVQQLVNMRAQFDDLQRQMSTGQKSANYAGLGLDRGVTVSLNAQLSGISGYDNTITNVMTRVNVMNTALGSMSTIGSTVRSAILPGNSPINSAGFMSAQATGTSSLDGLLSLLNSRAGDRYVFSGRASDTPAVETSDHILNGDGARAGLKQLISERNQADLGTNGLGRLNFTTVSPTSFSLAEDAVSPFGFKLASVASTMNSAGTFTGGAVSQSGGGAITSSTTLYGGAPGNNLVDTSGAATNYFTGGTTLSVNGHTITFAAAVAPVVSAPGATIVTAGQNGGTGAVVTDGAGNSTVYLGTTAGTTTASVGDVLNAIDLASGVQTSDAAGTLTVTPDGVIPISEQASIGASGAITLHSSAATNTSITGTANVLAELGLTPTPGPANATVTTTHVASNPSGSPASVLVDLSGSAPNPGDTLTFRFNLPDGTTASTTLTATASTTPGPGEFTIGATLGATATNLQTAMVTSIGKLAATSLTAASAVQASNDFFSADALNPPQRVNGIPSFATATSMIAGSAANTVIWYTGEAGTDPARSTATAKIDPTLSVSYGVRANEAGIRTLVQNTATLAAMTISASNPNATDLSSELNQRLTANMVGAPGAQTITTIEEDLASAQTAMQAAQKRHQQTSATLTDYLDQITSVSNEQVSAQILTLQTRMQASMQTTAMLFQTSLVNYLK